MRYHRACRSAFLVPTLILLLASCGGGNSPTSPSNPVITGLAVGSDLTIPSPETRQLTATLTTADGKGLECPAAAWTTSEPSVATVSQTGLLMTLSTGVAEISATCQGFSDSLRVRVTPPRPS